MDLPTRKHVFYHADRGGHLTEGQEIELDQNGLSWFGRTYYETIKTKKAEEMTNAQKREYYLELLLDQPAFAGFTSRMQAIFAANTIEEAIFFCSQYQPKARHPHTGFRDLRP